MTLQAVPEYIPPEPPARYKILGQRDRQLIHEHEHEWEELGEEEIGGRMFVVDVCRQVYEREEGLKPLPCHARRARRWTSDKERDRVLDKVTRARALWRDARGNDKE